MPPLTAPPAALLEGAALFLDFDGTLIELADTPGAIEVQPMLGPLLDRLSARLDGRVAIISGRSIDDLERHLPTFGLGLSGSHGLETRTADGRRVPASPPARLDEVRAEVGRFAERRAGLLVEHKPAGIALHFRRAPAEQAAVIDFMTALARRHDLAVQHGRMVVELRPAGADKGDALRAFMAHPPFAGARPVFVGDDLTDEHAFTAAAALGGTGILVGPDRETAARHRLETVSAVTAWLEAWA